VCGSYKTAIARLHLWLTLPLDSRADDCLVVSLSDERGVAVLDAGTGRLLSLNRLPTAQGSVKGQLSMSEGWLVDVSGDNEICVSVTFFACRSMAHSRPTGFASDLALRAHDPRHSRAATRSSAQVGLPKDTTQDPSLSLAFSYSRHCNRGLSLLGIRCHEEAPYAGFPVEGLTSLWVLRYVSHRAEAGEIERHLPKIPAD
jgi:hypothetical protein